MDDRHRIHLRKLEQDLVVPAFRHELRRKELPRQFREHVSALGHQPEACLETFVDLGLSDGEIARYFHVPKTCITELCGIWHLRH